MSEPIVRMSRPDDINDILDLDVKCCYYPLSLEEWRVLIQGKDADATASQEKAKVSIVTIYRERVALAVTRPVDDDVVLIERFGVIEKYRGHGVGRLLMEEVLNNARHYRADVLRIVVPSIYCQPEASRDKDDMGAFLNAMKFKPTGKVVPNYTVMYGETVEGYAWERRTL